ncbi:MAG: MFS transporter [Rickettsiales bacterium]
MDVQNTVDVSADGEKQDSPLPVSTMLYYGAGQTGAQLFRDSPATLLPLFMTTILGVAPWLAGVVVLIPKMWVIICDPIMGAYSDSRKAQHGRKPFLLVGAILTSISFAVMFSFSGFTSPVIAAIVIGALFFVGSTAFSAFSVPYLAVASELSNDPHERTKLLSFRMVFTVLGVILGFGLAQPLVFKLGGDAAAWSKMAVIFASICLLSMLVTALGVPRNRGDGVHKPSATVKQRYQVVRNNKPFVVLSLAYLVQSIAQSCGFAVVGFVFLYAIQDINLLFPFILVMACGSIGSQPFWVTFSRKIGKEPAFIIACLGWLLVTFTWLWVEAGTDVLVSLPLFGDLATEEAWVLVRAFIIGITNSGFSLLSFSMLTDTIEAQKKVAGTVDEGMFSGVFSAIEKAAFALGPLLAGTILSLTGFQASVGGAVAQSEESIQGMIWCYSLVPFACMSLSLLLFLGYKSALTSFRQ